jgi:hypothetical protein
VKQVLQRIGIRYDRIGISWVDSRGERRSDEGVVAASA